MFFPKLSPPPGANQYGPYVNRPYNQPPPQAAPGQAPTPPGAPNAVGQPPPTGPAAGPPTGAYPPPGAPAQQEYYRPPDQVRTEQLYLFFIFNFYEIFFIIFINKLFYLFHFAESSTQTTSRFCQRLTAISRL